MIVAGGRDGRRQSFSRKPRKGQTQTIETDYRICRLALETIRSVADWKVFVQAAGWISVYVTRRDALSQVYRSFLHQNVSVTETPIGYSIEDLLLVIVGDDNLICSF